MEARKLKFRQINYLSSQNNKISEKKFFKTNQKIGSISRQCPNWIIWCIDWLNIESKRISRCSKERNWQENWRLCEQVNSWDEKTYELVDGKCQKKHRRK